MDIDIRRPHADELALLPGIEIASGECFREIGMAWVADDDPLPLPRLTAAHHRGDVRVAAAAAPVAFVVTAPLDDAVHIEQISVHPAHARRRIGAALIEHVAEAARAQGAAALTLTTFGDVPWNAPYYARLGFRELPASRCTAGLAELTREEARRGLAAERRVAMRRALH